MTDIPEDRQLGTVIFERDPLTQRLLDLVSAIDDLAFAHRALLVLKTMLPPSPREPAQTDGVDPVQLALWNAATIAYGRCFGRGRRRAVARSLIPTGAARVAHDSLIDFRNQHVAHLDDPTGENESTELIGDVAYEGDRLAMSLRSFGKKAMLPTRRTLIESIALVRQVLSVAETEYEAGNAKIGLVLGDLSKDVVLEALDTGRRIRLGRPIERRAPRPPVGSP
jgi:hypothetical protein